MVNLLVWAGRSLYNGFCALFPMLGLSLNLRNGRSLIPRLYMSPVRTGHTFFSQVNTSMSHFKIRLLSAYFACFAVYISFANCKCKLDTCTVELSESERRSGWKPLASVLGDAAAAFGCVNRVEELVKQFLRGAVAKLLARPSVQFISCSQDILSRESLNGHALRNKGSKQPVVAFVLGTFP